MPTPIRNLDLNLLKVFDAVMSEQSITRAAVRLSVSQPAISNALGRLRALYNDELFVRSANGVIPTPKAQEIAAPIREALRSIEGTLDIGAAFHPNSSRRSFTVALTDYGELYFLPHLMAKLTTGAPGIDIVCLPHPGATLTLEMKSGAVDLVWDWKKIDESDFCVERIFEDYSICVARKGHPDIQGPLTLEKFLGLQHVALRPTRTHIPMIERRLEALDLQRTVAAEVSHILVMPNLVATTNLVACMPARLARFYAKQFDLELYPNPVFEEPVPVYQMWHRHFDRDPGHEWLRGVLRDLAARF